MSSFTFPKMKYSSLILALILIFFTADLTLAASTPNITQAAGQRECLKFLAPTEKNACKVTRGCVDYGTPILLMELKKTTDTNALVRLLIRLGDLNSYLDKTLRQSAIYYQRAYDELKTQNNPSTYIMTEVLEKKMGVQLRFGELQNCLENHNERSCVFPLTTKAFHSLKTGAAEAIKTAEQILIIDPKNDSARWIINLAHMALGQYPKGVPKKYLLDFKTFNSPIAFPHFIDIAGKMGLTSSMTQNRAAVMEDINGDGFLDIIKSGRDYCEPVVYLEQNGQGQLVDKSAESNLGKQLRVFNILQGDFNNDGLIDLYLLRGAWDEKDEKIKVYNSLMMNQGKAIFKESTMEAGLMGLANSSNSAAIFDYNNDGWLDLFVCNEHRSPDFFENLKNGKFKNIIKESGIKNEGICKGVTAADYDQDGRIDLFLANYYSPKKLFHNNNNGTFSELTSQALKLAPDNLFSTWFFDYDNDGREDLYLSVFGRKIKDMVRNIESPKEIQDKPHLIKNLGGGKFIDNSEALGLNMASMAMGANFGDINNDGFKDILLGTGGPNLNALTPNKMLLNLKGIKFIDVTEAGGFGHLQKGHGVSFGDLDRDGYVEILSMHGGLMPSDAFFPSLYQNPGMKAFHHHWVQLKLEGVRSNRSAIGAKIEITVSLPTGNNKIFHTINSGSSFGTNPLMAHIGLGTAKIIKELKITWPFKSSVQIFKNVKIDSFYKIKEDQKTMEKLNWNPIGLKYQVPATHHH